MRPIWSASSDSGNAPMKQRKVMTFQGRAELLDVYCRLRSAATVASHFKINESSIKTIVKRKKWKEICENIITPMPACMKIYLLWNSFLILYQKCSFYVGVELL